MSLAFEKQGGLVPAIVQDAESHRVLMLGYMDAAAVEATRATGRVTFFSRRRRAQWVKGETSGHFLELVSMHVDCDGDSLLVMARPAGPTCHAGTRSCFDGAPGSGMAELDAVIAQRIAERPEGSYIARLMEAGLARMAQKVGEEGVETAIAAVTGGEDALLEEAADLVFHLAVLLRASGKSLHDVEAVLGRRRCESCVG